MEGGRDGGRGGLEVVDREEEFNLQVKGAKRRELSSCSACVPSLPPSLPPSSEKGRR